MMDVMYCPMCGSKLKVASTNNNEVLETSQDNGGAIPFYMGRVYVDCTNDKCPMNIGMVLHNIGDHREEKGPGSSWSLSYAD